MRRHSSRPQIHATPCLLRYYLRGAFTVACPRRPNRIAALPTTWFADCVVTAPLELAACGAAIPRLGCRRGCRGREHIVGVGGQGKEGRTEVYLSTHECSTVTILREVVRAPCSGARAVSYCMALKRHRFWPGAVLSIQVLVVLFR